ncbi:MAG: hypothetical protein IT453_20950 [Planctomycetes bacterium]|nr:hypothetical protein [Planctomycetota bacterium]
MCGIFGVVFRPDAGIAPDFARSVVERLYKFSETRGKEAAGLAIHDGRSIQLLKEARAASVFIETQRYREVFEGALAHWSNGASGVGAKSALAMIGHSRLVTNGFQSSADNNQPVWANGVVGIHNGIIVNDAELWLRHPELQRKSEVDTEVLVNLLRLHFDATKDAAEATRLAFEEIRGAASIAMFMDDLESLLLATNTGSLFRLTNDANTFLAFASERFILQKLATSSDFERHFGKVRIAQVRAGTGVLVGLKDLAQSEFRAIGPKAGEPKLGAAAAPAPKHLQIVDHTRRARNLRRCKQCILPETYPFMDFDEKGVCRYCRNWRRIAVKGPQKLAELVEPYRSKDGSPDVIVAFSGGRDSSYGLHYVKTQLGMNPVAFTYDWGFVTDLARRNQARICGKLGVEHILRSADITTKRRYVRKNVEAWLKRPELGMVTLFTAGDKEFYSHARQLRKETGIKLVIFSTGNMIEDTPYKTGLCGIREGDHGMTLTGLPLKNELHLLCYYAWNYLKNPRYLNESLFDTFNAYYQTFVVKDDFLYLFHYLEWREEEIVGTIRREYDWEVATDTTSTWRIGDGTAAFYNYIYDTIAGFTEDEVMLSNMIREGHLTRDQALAKSEEYRAPRMPSIREYAQIAGFNCEEALAVINAAPKLY